MTANLSSLRLSYLHLRLLVVFVLSLLSFQGFSQGQLWGTTRIGGKSGGVIFKTNADGSNITTIQKEFTVDVDGSHPRNGLTLASNGKFYGVTSQGGKKNRGVLYEYDPATNGYSTKFDFAEFVGYAPTGMLLQASNGKLYGLTTNGSYGVFEFDIATATCRNVVYLPDQPYFNNGGLMQAANGKVYGITGSAIFELDLTSSTLTRTVSIPQGQGFFGMSQLVETTPGVLYGTTYTGGNVQGVLYEYNIADGAYTIRHHFETDTALPTGNIVLASNGMLYGFSQGAAANSVSIYVFDPVSKIFGVRTSFTNLQRQIQFSSLQEGADGKLYGRVSPKLNVTEILRFNPANGNTETLYTMNAEEGIGAYGNFTVGADGKLYGTTFMGGLHGIGTIFSYDVPNNTLTKKLDFGASTEGAFPYSRLVKAGNGKLYGMTSGGGALDVGTIFEIDPANGNYTVKHQFDKTNGASPLGGLTLATNGKLYGMTSFGGTAGSRIYLEEVLTSSGDIAGVNGLGVLFEFDPAAGTYTKLRNFDYATGCNPYGNLMQASNGKLYGMTNQGGAQGGVLFEYDLNGTYSVKKNFPGVDPVPDINWGPRGDLIEVNGKLYGLLPNFGANNGGTLFELNLSDGAFTTKIDFPSQFATGDGPGAIPLGTLTLGADGKLYGLNSRGFNTQGGQSINTIFEYDIANNIVIKKFKIPTSTGIGTYASLSASPNGKLYTTSFYSNNLGSGEFVFRDFPGSVIEFDPSSNSAKKKFDFNYSNGALPGYGTLLYLPGKMDQTIAFEAPPAKVFGDATFTLPELSSAGLAISYSSADPSVATVSGNVVTIHEAGSTMITAGQAGDANYNAAPNVGQTLIVNKTTQVITFAELTTKKFTDGKITLAATTSSGLPVTYESQTPTIATMNGNDLIFVATGQAHVIARQAGNRNYQAAQEVHRYVEILKGDQTITFNALAQKAYGDQPFNVVATSSASLPVLLASSNNQVATISGDKITIVGAGTATITASQSGNGNYNAATPVQRVLEVAKIDQAITFSSITDKVAGGAQFDLQATSTSSLPVAFSTTSANITLTGKTVKPVSAGRVTITASQSGDGNYWIAPQVNRSFCINPEKPLLTANGLLLTSSSSAGNQWYRDGELINNTTGQTLQVTNSGSYQVKVTIDGCEGEKSDARSVTVIVTGIETQESDSFITIHPNPVETTLFVSILNNKESNVTVGAMNGVILHREVTRNESVEISVENYPSGMYWVKVVNGSGTMVKKFMKR